MQTAEKVISRTSMQSPHSKARAANYWERRYYVEEGKRKAEEKQRKALEKQLKEALAKCNVPRVSNKRKKKRKKAISENRQAKRLRGLKTEVTLTNPETGRPVEVKDFSVRGNRYMRDLARLAQKEGNFSGSPNTWGPKTNLLYRIMRAAFRKGYDPTYGRMTSVVPPGVILQALNDEGLAPTIDLIELPRDEEKKERKVLIKEFTHQTTRKKNSHMADIHHHLLLPLTIAN